MTIKITYMVHGTTSDNLSHLASGHNDIELCERGITEAKQLGELQKSQFDVVFTSDLNRAIVTAELAFSERCPHIQDARLRECNYGDLTQKKKDWSIGDFIEKPYPNGESYRDVEARIKSFIAFLKENYDGKHIAIVAHQAPQLALTVLTENKTWNEAIASDWRITKSWQPGWDFLLH